MYIHLEIIGWQRISAGHKPGRKDYDSVVGMPESVINEAHSDEANNSDKEKLKLNTIDEELYSYITRKLNNKVKQIRHRYLKRLRSAQIRVQGDRADH